MTHQRPRNECIANRLISLAADMDSVAWLMRTSSDRDSEMHRHGVELLGAASMAREWAREARKAEAEK